MIYLDTNSFDPFFNFGVEYMSCEKDIEEPVLLLWRTSPTVMLGRYQNIYEEVNLKFVRENNINLVRRMSGGGCIYTDMGSVQFSIIKNKESDKISFDEFLIPVKNTLEGMLGDVVEMSDRNDLHLLGKKISGNAQFSHRNKLVHHGSLLFDTDMELMSNCLSYSPIKYRSKGIPSIRANVENLKLDMDDFKFGLFRELCVDEIRDLTYEEVNTAKGYGDKIFRSWENIYGSNPKFSKESSIKADGGVIKLLLNVKEGYICDLDFQGDFFSLKELEKLKADLIGVRYSREDIAKALESSEAWSYFFNIKNEDLLKLFVEQILNQ